MEHGLITVNKPEKHSLPRQFKINGKLTAMLNLLPKQRDKVFHVDLRTMRKRFMWQRNRIASKVENPKAQTNDLPHSPPLVWDDGVPQDQKHPTRSGEAWTQEHDEHADLYTFSEL